MAAGVLQTTGSDAYGFLLGDGSPVVLTLVAAVLCVSGLRVIERRAWASAEPVEAPTYAGVAALGAALTLPVVLVDVLGGFPEDLNVAWPGAFLFYPSIGMVAETAFHVVPLAALAVLASVVRVAPRRLWPVAVVAVSLIEPSLQVAWGVEHSPLWANAYVGAHLFAFNVVGVHILRRHGFLAVWTYRMGYYLMWHIVWGALRLSMLFEVVPL